MHGGLTAVTHKDSDIKYSVQEQSSSPSGCVDEYFADHVDVDSTNSTSAAHNSKQLPNVVELSQSGTSDSKKTMLTFDDKSFMKMKVVVPEAMPAETEQNIQGKTTFDDEPNKIKDEKTHGERESNGGSNIESNLSLDHASSKQQYEGLSAQVTTNFAFLILVRMWSILMYRRKILLLFRYSYSSLMIFSFLPCRIQGVSMGMNPIGPHNCCLENCRLFRQMNIWKKIPEKSYMDSLIVQCMILRYD